MAGLWERWRDPASSETILSCTIIVCGSRGWMESYLDRLSDTGTTACDPELDVAPDFSKGSARLVVRNF
jgi:hypothetical protein